MAAAADTLKIPFSKLKRLFVPNDYAHLFHLHHASYAQFVNAENLY